jgi:DNA-dependent RNA polymerase auxiliary subunit epsilon
MLSNDWRETCEKRLRLPETQPEVLEVYLHWMYTGNVVLGPSPAEADTVFRVELYLLDDYLDDMAFCDAVVEGLVELSRGHEQRLPSASAVQLAWSKTSAESPLRAVIKELFLGVAMDSMVENLLNNDDFPYEFILDLLAGLMENNKSFCKRSISHKSDAQIREACKGFVRNAGEKGLSSSAGTAANES